MMICVVALVFVGPKKLPYVLNTLGRWIRKARIVVQDMRAQSGIDDILRAEGLHGGLNELRSLVRVQHAQILSSVTSGLNPSAAPPVSSPEPEASAPAAAESPVSPYPDPAFAAPVEVDLTREYPPEGADAYGALPDDLVGKAEPFVDAPAATPALDPSAATSPAGTEPDTAAAAEPEADPPKPPAESAA